MLRFVFIFVLVLLFLVPVYHILKKRAIRVKSELEDDNPDLDMRLVELSEKEVKLLRDCDTELQAAKDRAAKIKNIKNNIQGGK